MICTWPGNGLVTNPGSVDARCMLREACLTALLAQASAGVRAELLYIQPAPADPADSSWVATNLRQILRFLGLPAASSSIPFERDLVLTQS